MEFQKEQNIIIDEKQTISFVKVYPIAQLPDIKEILHVIETKKNIEKSYK